MRSISKLWRFTNNRRNPLRYEAIPIIYVARTIGKIGRFNQKILSKLHIDNGLKKSPPISEVYPSNIKHSLSVSTLYINDASCNYENKLSSIAHNLTSIK